MKKYIIIGILIVAIGVGIYFVFGNSQEREAHEIQPARIAGDQFEVKTPDGWEQMTIKGVNMGMAKPGTFPGEAAITEDEYYRWFEQIGEMNANTVRVYTLHPPGFYKALARYNNRNEENIYLMHGLWADEGKMHDGLDAFDEALNEEFDQDMLNVMDAIHGGGTVEAEPGKASGNYTKDVSGYVIGWVMGVEWYPPFVVGTNEKHEDIGQYDGSFYRTESASPFEHWLAQKMDYISNYENETYGSLRPMSFTNWVTTDILDHPSDSSDMEDLVSVDPNVIYTKGEMEAIGQYASYHIYPYYPDFLNNDEKYLDYTDHRGEKNNYAGYLNEMVKEHRLPILVAEFGVPGSRGLTHRNPFGWDQGFHSEKKQGEIITHLYEDIIEEGMLGGLVFTWQDEWFKRTWNTMDYDDPDRRPFWSNAQTNEQQFGLLSFDTHKIKVDGEATGWENDPLYTGDGTLKSLTMDSDERYLYLKVEHDPGLEGSINIPLNIVSEQGNHTLDDQVESEDGIDFLIDINSEQSRVTVDDYYDFFEIQYGHTLEMIDVKGEPKKDSGVFNSIRLALNKEYYLPDRGETLPFESYETGLLREGIGDPEAEGYDSLTDYNWNREEGVLEIRLPWQLIGARDPSQREFIGNIVEDGLEASVQIDGIGIGAVVMDGQHVVDSLPAVENNRIPALTTYTWEKWDLPESDERLKKSYDILKETFGAQQ
ncbi:hypothetical protein ACFOLA_13080 [Salinicoccus hispanicus]|uniref:Family 2 glycosyl transferase n=1 Tax=Salinicoccus hispanicus TaxID=157225 RepID=A0A6N8U5T5_9STAP|nr:hypothetical protein [Salinicoccus hispanicus]MXQ51865.1 hypothetical protein [Salinicoccus hispanicus]